MFKNKNKLYCFTPEVMITTFIIEVILVIYAFIRYRTTVFGRLSILILFFLALFQLSEYQICIGGDSLIWAKIGIVSITLLPILGLHLIYLVCKKNGWFVRSAYVVVIASTAFLIFSSTAITGAICNGNYVIFESTNSLYWLYAIYYTSVLLYGMLIASNELKSQKIRKRYLIWIIIGYLSFLLPMAGLYLFYGVNSNSIISVMCGFALLFAFIIVLKILTLYHKNI